MRPTLFVFLLAALLAGCQSKPATQAAAGGPVAIDALTDQKVVWTCPECGMDYDRGGQCPMCKVHLVEMSVAYVCPVDGQAVEHAGKCPRCDANARVVKTAVAVAVPGGGAPATPEASSGDASAASAGGGTVGGS